MKPMQKPRFDRAGAYLIRNDRDRLAAAVSVIRCALSCVTAYHAQGPDAVVNGMGETLSRGLAEIMRPDRESL